MKLRIGLGVSLNRRRATTAGPPAAVAPLLANLGFSSAPLIGEAVEVDYSVTGTAPITTTFQWTRDGTPITGATSESYTPVNADLTAVLGCTVTATNDVDSDSDSANAGPAGLTYIEDWARFDVGDLRADLVADGYEEIGGTNTPIVAVISDPDPAFDKTLDFRGGASSARALGYHPLRTILTGATVDYIEVLMQIENKIPNTQEQTIFFKSQSLSAGSPTTSMTTGGGFNIRLNVANSERYLFHQIPGEDATSAVGTRVNAGSGTFGSVLGDVYNVRFRIAGNDTSLRTWLASLPEPEGWGSERTHTEAIPTNGFVLGARTTSANSHNIRFWSMGVNVPAPWPVGYEAPPASTGDPLSFVSPTEETSVTTGGGVITFNFGGIV